MNNNKPPQKSPQNWENKHFWHFWNNARHTKNKPFNIKTSKKPNPKDTICHVQKQPTIFHRFSVFSTYSFCFWKAVFCWKHNKNRVFRKQLLKNTVSKTHFFTHVKNTFFQKKVSFLVLAIFAETTIFIVFPGLHCFGPKKSFLAKTDSVHENARFFLPSWRK